MHQYTYIKTLQKKKKKKMQNYLTIAVFFLNTSTASIELGVCLAVSEVASETLLVKSC